MAKIGMVPKAVTSAGGKTRWKCGDCGLSHQSREVALTCCAREIEEKPPTSAHQVGGDHYTSKAVQPWDAMAAWLSPEQFAGFLRGNAIKYLSRAGSKGEAIEDYRKAAHYLAKLIEFHNVGDR